MNGTVSIIACWPFLLLIVIPAKAGIQFDSWRIAGGKLASGFRRNDDTKTEAP